LGYWLPAGSSILVMLAMTGRRYLPRAVVIIIIIV
jgi:hypothetical protein